MSSAALPIGSRLLLRPPALAPAGLLAAAAAAVVFAGGLSSAAPEPSPARPAVAASAPLVVPNAGQSRPAVRFEARAGAGALFFTAREVVLAGAPATVRLRFDGASAGPRVEASDRRPGVVNLLRGSDPARWRTGLPAFGGVRYRGLYPGVDVHHAAAATPAGPWLRSTFTVAPGADPARIRWRYAGTGGAGLDAATGELEAGPLRLAAPVAWQLVDGVRHPVDVGYDVGRDGSVGFDMGRHDRSQPLFAAVAPAATASAATSTTTSRLAYSGFLGGTVWDELYDVDVDPAGNAYVTGFTQSADFPVAGALQPGFGEVQDAVVARVSATGQLLYSTYLGGDATDAGQNIAVDRAGNAYVTGRTESENFPTQSALQKPVNGRRCQEEPCHDAFVTKLDANGRLVFSTYLGGTGNEEGWGIAVDGDGRAHVTGNTDSDDFPVRRPLQPVNRSRGCEGDVPCPLETFAAKFSRSGTALHWATYLGGRAGDLSGGIAVDGAGDVHLTGTTRSSDFPTLRALQPEIKGLGCGPPPGVPCTDVFLTKLDRDGKLRFSTYLGGTEGERSGGVAADSHGRSHLTGSTLSEDFPTVHPVQPSLEASACGKDEPLEACDDAFAAGVAADGRALFFGTYLGGAAEDQGLGIALDAKGTIHLSGSTDSRGFPTKGALQPKLGGRIDGFLARLAPGGRSLLSSTFLGGRDDERLNGVAADRAGSSLLTGRTASTDFPTAGPVQAALAGDIDGVVAKVR